MVIALEAVVVLMGVALLVGFLASRFMPQNRGAGDEKPKRAPSSQYVTAELERLFSLYQSGALTHDEYQTLKERLIGGNTTTGSTLPAGWHAQVEAELRLGRKIEAIKLYREATGLGLKEAKDAVEDMERSLRMGGQ
jgi:hypothetical protein